MIINCKNIILADKVKFADTFFKRLIGLMGKKDLPIGEGLFLKNCSSIHCFFMKFPIDVVYLSKEMEVLHVETVKPWKVGSFVKNTKNILELAAGSAKQISVGDQIRIYKSGKK
jgi:uncharacterized membrane protein (UPF0127 family)